MLPATALPPDMRLSQTTVVINSAILVLREGLECILVMAAVMASLRKALDKHLAAEGLPAIDWED